MRGLRPPSWHLEEDEERPRASRPGRRPRRPHPCPPSGPVPSPAQGPRRPGQTWAPSPLAAASRTAPVPPPLFPSPARPPLPHRSQSSPLGARRSPAAAPPPPPGPAGDRRRWHSQTGAEGCGADGGHGAGKGQGGAARCPARVPGCPSRRAWRVTGPAPRGKWRARGDKFKGG